MILRFEMFDLENLGQGHRVQHSQFSHSIANINIYKSLNWAFFVGWLSWFSRKQHSEFCDLENVGQGSRYTTIAMAPFDGKYIIHDFLFDGNFHVCSISRKLNKIQKFGLEKKANAKLKKRIKWELRQVMENSWFNISDFARILATWEHMLAQTWPHTYINTHTPTHTYIHTHVHAHAHAHAHAHEYAYTHTRTHTYTRNRTHMRTHTHTQI